MNPSIAICDALTMNLHTTRHAAVTSSCFHPNQKHKGYVLPQRLLNADQPTVQRFRRASQLHPVSSGPFASPVHGRAAVPQATAEEEQASASNGSHFSPGADQIAVVKGTGSSIVPHQGSGNNGGSGGGSGGGNPRNDGPGDDPDNQTKFLLLLLSIALGAAGFFGIYHLIKAIHGVTSRRRAAQPTVGCQQRFV